MENWHQHKKSAFNNPRQRKLSPKKASELTFKKSKQEKPDIQSRLKMSLFFPNGQRLQQDNDPKHRSIMAQEIMAENGINHWDVWPSGKYMY